MCPGPLTPSLLGLQPKAVKAEGLRAATGLGMRIEGRERHEGRNAGSSWLGEKTQKEAARSGPEGAACSSPQPGAATRGQVAGRGLCGAHTPSLLQRQSGFLTQKKPKLVGWAGRTKLPQQLPGHFPLGGGVGGG